MTTGTQTNGAGRAFCLFDNIEINDREKLEEYKEKVFPVVAAFAGKYIVAAKEFGWLKETGKHGFW
ncbi:MAG: DUF1330 domain-containing protein [Chitinophagales bacterium]|nr:DUF1330 domain-containing protein [Chitinophagales bacterium]